MTTTNFLAAFRAGYWGAANDSDGNWFWGVNSPSKRPAIRPSKYWLCTTGGWWPGAADWVITDVGLAEVDVDLPSVDRLYAAMEAKRALIPSQSPKALIWNPCSWGFLVTNSTKPAPAPEQPKIPTKTPRERRIEERDARLAEVWGLFGDGKISAEIRDERLRKILDQYSDLN